QTDRHYASSRPSVAILRSEQSVRQRSAGAQSMRDRREKNHAAAYAAASLGQRSVSMASPDTLRYTRIPLNNGSGAIPAVGFGTLIPDPLATKEATKTALEVGFRHFDCAERYRNEEAVGEAMQATFRAGAIRREDVFITTKLWNTNHRPGSSLKGVGKTDFWVGLGSDRL